MAYHGTTHAPTPMQSKWWNIIELHLAIKQALNKLTGFEAHISLKDKQ